MSEELAGGDTARVDGVVAKATEAGTAFTPKQVVALEALVAGKGVTQAAYAAGVSRQTIFRWRKELPAFSDAIQAWTDAALQSAQSLLIESTEIAAQAVCDAVANGDPYVGLEMLRSTGLIGRAADRSAGTGKSPAPVPAVAIGALP